MQKLVISREAGEVLNIRCSEIELVFDDGSLLVNVSEEFGILLTLRGIGYREDVISTIYQ